MQRIADEEIDEDEAIADRLPAVPEVSGDPYLDPRSGVFRNRLGMTDRAELATAEKRL